MTKVFIDKKTDKFDNIGNIISYIKDLHELVNDGQINPLTAIIFLKELEKKSKEYKSKIDDIAIEELSKYGNEGTDMNGYSIKLKKAAGRWDFKHIQEIVDAEHKLKELKEKHKLAYSADGKILIEDTGEVIEPANFKMGKEIIVLTKKR
tara:strand:+ start:6619 stop:7068 length:450 start_codon:yes stop_codon:yes gene_type:complete